MLVFVYRTSYSCKFLIKVKFYRRVLEKYGHNKFYENPSSGSRVGPCGWADGQTDMTKIIVVFRNFENAPKKGATS